MNLINKSIIFLLLCLVLTGCGLPQAERTEMITVQDGLGHSLVIPQTPRRVVALDIGGSEIILLLLESERIAGVSKYLDDPGAANLKKPAQAVPHRTENSVEQILALQADLIIVATPGKDELVGQLKQLGKPVFLIKRVVTTADVEENVRVLGKALGKEARAAELLQAMRHDLEAVKRQWEKIPPTQKRRVTRITTIGAAGGTDTSFQGIAEAAGCFNVAAEVGLEHGSMSKEQLVAVNPDLLILPSWDHAGGKTVAGMRDDYLSDPALVTVKGVREHNFIYIPDYYLISQSPYIVFAVLCLAEAAYGIQIDSELEKILPDGTVRHPDLKKPEFTMSHLQWSRQ